MNKQKKNKIIIFIVITTIVLILTSLFPYSGDDWAWGSSVGLERLRDGFEGYNGRYLGNIAVLLMTRSNIFRIITMTVVLMGIIIIIYRFTNKNNLTLVILTTMLIFAMPKEIFKQAVVWTSGFSNYVLSTILVLIYIYMIRSIFKKEYFEYGNKNIIVAFLLGISGTLFMENVTIYIVLLSLGVIIYTFLKFKKLYRFTITYAIGSIIGTIIMFSNSAYYNVATNSDNYRAVATSQESGMIQGMIEAYTNIIHRQLFLNNTILNLCLVAVLLMVVYKSKVIVKKKFALDFCLLGIIGYNFYSVIKKISPEWQILLRYTKYFEGIISIIYFISLMGFILIYIKDKEKRDKLIFILVSILFLAGPLLVVKPIGSRCFFITYIFFILLINELLDIVVINNICFNKGISIISCILAIHLISIYLYVFKIDCERIRFVEEQLKSNTKEIVLTELPYPNYLWTDTPTESVWIDRFKLFHNIPKDVELKVITLKEWHKNYEN